MGDPRRAYAGALLLLALGGLVLLVSFGLTWATAQVPLLTGSDEAVQGQDLAGQDLFPGASMSAWVALAATAGVLATRSWGRLVVAVIAALAGLVAVLASGVFASRPATMVDDVVSSQVGTQVSVASTSTLGWLPALVGGLAVVAAGIWIAARGRRWPAMGGRYERPSPHVASRSAWDLQDTGRDPTDDLVE